MGKEVNKRQPRSKRGRAKKSRGDFPANGLRAAREGFSSAPPPSPLSLRALRSAAALGCHSGILLGVLFSFAFRLPFCCPFAFSFLLSLLPSLSFLFFVFVLLVLGLVPVLVIVLVVSCSLFLLR